MSKPNVCHKRRSDDESSESDGEQPSVKKLKSSERESNNLKESLSRKYREAYAWLMDISAKKYFQECLRANEVVTIDDEDDKEKEPDILEMEKTEIDLCDEDQEKRPRVSCSTPFYTDGTMVGFGLKQNRPAVNGFRNKNLKAKDQTEEPIKLRRIVDQRLTPLTNPGIDVQFMLDEPQITVNDDELQIISEIINGKPGVNWKEIRPGRKFMVPVLPPCSPIECITVESNDVSRSKVTSGKDPVRKPPRKTFDTTLREKSVSCSKAYRAHEVVREQEKQQYKLLLEKIIQISVDRPVRKKTPAIVVDLTNENEELLSWSKPFNKDLLEKPLDEYRFNLYKPKPVVTSAKSKLESVSESSQ